MSTAKCRVYEEATAMRTDHSLLLPAHTHSRAKRLTEQAGAWSGDH